MIYYLTGAILGGMAGYFVLYRLIGCSDGSCPITKNPYISIVYGIVIGVLVAGLIKTPNKNSAMSGTEQVPTVEYRKISVEEAKKRMDSGEKIIVVDVRTEAEYRTGHIPNAILIPNDTIAKKMPELLPDLDAQILVYCRSGSRSAQAAKKLIAIGYTNIYDFGGIMDWPYDTVASDTRP